MSTPALRHVRVLEGSITAENFDRVAEIVMDELHDVIGLQLRQEVWPDDTDPPLQVYSMDTGRLVIFKRDGTEVELVINGGIAWQHGGWNIDGFYMVKPGGTHQGVSSFGLIQTDEAAVRLNPAIRLVRVTVGNVEPEGHDDRPGGL
jgi:hypothetical protein